MSDATQHPADMQTPARYIPGQTVHDALTQNTQHFGPITEFTETHKMIAFMELKGWPSHRIAREMNLHPVRIDQIRMDPL